MRLISPLSVAGARRILKRELEGFPLRKEKRSLQEALGFVSAESVFSPDFYPRFHTSAMDGFAVRSADTRFASCDRPVFLRVREEITAGTRKRLKPLREGEVARIFTGAPIPPGCDAVIEQEKVERDQNFVVLTEAVAKHRNIRFRGEGTRKGQNLLEKGERLTPERLAYLASCGIARVSVFESPRVFVGVSGAELVDPGKKPKGFSVFDSNGVFLQATLAKLGITVSPVHLPDHAGALEKFRKDIQEADVVLLTGGVSVGDRDFIRPALKALGVQEFFWRVWQKPGFPMWFGRKNRTFFFGLPGNPAAVAMCFHVYLGPFLKALCGWNISWRAPARRELAQNVQPFLKKTWFLKVREKKGKLYVLEGQGSHRLDSLARATGFAEIPPGKKFFRKGTQVRYFPFEGGAV